MSEPAATTAPASAARARAAGRVPVRASRMLGRALIRLTAILSLLSAAVAISAIASPTAPVAPSLGALTIDPAVGEQRLATGMLLIPDPEDHLAFDDVAMGLHDADGKRLEHDPPSLGYPRHAYWLRLRLHNGSDVDLERLLVLWRGTKYTQQVHFETREGTLLRELGPGSDSVSGDLRSRHGIVRLRLPAGDTGTLTIRFDSRISTVLDYRLLDEVTLARHEWRDQWLYGALLGFDVAISSFVLLLGLRTREPIYFWFAAAAAGGVTYVIVYEGLFGSLLQIHSAWLLRWLGTLLGVGGIVCFLMFNRSLHDTPSVLPRFDRYVLMPLAALGLVLTLASAVVPWPFIPLGAAWSLIAVVIGGGAFLWAARHGEVRLRGFAFAVILFLSVTAVFSLQLLAVIPDTAVVHTVRIAALALSMLLFSFAVSERVRQRQEALHAAVRRSESLLQQTVEERTRELSTAKDRAEAALHELQATQKQLVASEKLASLGQLVAGVAHEINTPLGVALTASSYLGDHTRRVAARMQHGTLARSELNRFLGEAEEASRMIDANLERAAHLVRSFKQVSVDRSSDDRRGFELAAYLGDLVESLRPSWKRRPITMTIDCAPDIRMDGFPGALGQVVTNLIQNALVHAFDEDGSGRIRLAARPADSDSVTIEIGDDGRGIEPDHLPRIFDPFFTTRRGQGGTGLGLHITFNLVSQKLGGRIDAFSTPGQGTRFEITLPLRAPVS